MKGTPVLAQKKAQSVAFGQGMSLAQIKEAVNDHRRWLREAIEQSELKHEYVAGCLGVKPTYLSKMLALQGDQKPLALEKMVLLPPEVWGRYVDRMAIEADRMNTVTVTVRSGADKYVMGMRLAAAFGADLLTVKVLAE